MRPHGQIRKNYDRLIAFLEGLPPRKFAMNLIITFIDENGEEILNDKQAYKRISEVKLEKRYDCTTVGCICGWAAVLAPPKMKKEAKAKSYGKEWNVAQEFLDLNDHESELVFKCLWPKKVCKSEKAWGLYTDNFDRLKPKVRKRAMINVIKYVRDNGVDWQEMETNDNGNAEIEGQVSYPYL